MHCSLTRFVYGADVEEERLIKERMKTPYNEHLECSLMKLNIWKCPETEDAVQKARHLKRKNRCVSP